MSQTVPTEPGWWWVEVEGRRRVVEVERLADGGLWFDLADEEYSVPGGGGDDYFEFGGEMSWLAPVASMEEVERLRSFRAAVGDIQAGATDSDDDVLALVQADFGAAHDCQTEHGEVERLRAVVTELAERIEYDGDEKLSVTLADLLNVSPSRVPSSLRTLGGAK